jgi:hypothetical protein
VCDVLGEFKQLQHLYLAGNPLALARSYKLGIITRIPWLQVLDGNKVVEVEKFV